MGSCIGGVPVRLHYTFFLLLLIEVLASLRFVDDHPVFILFVALLYGPILLITIVVHEFGHALTTKKLGGEVGGIVLWPLGGFALCGPTDRGAAGDLMVAIAGPLTHIPQMGFWILIYAIVSSGDFSNFRRLFTFDQLEDGFTGFVSVLSVQSFWLNSILIVFNLLVPAYPLDGGRCLAASLILCGVGIVKAAYVTSIMGMLIAAALGVWGLATFFYEDNPNGILTVLVAIFIFSSSSGLYSLTKAGRVREHPIFGRACYDQTETATVAEETEESVNECPEGTMA